MTRWWIIAAMAVLVLAGCSLSGSQPSRDTLKQQTVAQVSGAEKVLACMEETRSLSGKSFREAFEAGTKQAAESRADEALLRLVCLSLHENARHSQFRVGIETAKGYVSAHPEESGGTRGLLLLMQRLDKERVARWTQRNRWLEEKEGLEEENKRLMEKNSQLEQAAEQHRGRVQDLQKQIEQLKNIENIIKERDR